jgi:hypothetical protein
MLATSPTRDSHLTFERVVDYLVALLRDVTSFTTRPV